MQKAFSQGFKIKRPNIFLYSTSSYNSNESDLLQRSIVPTKHFQQSLPKLPIPKLEGTLARYKASQSSLLDSTSMQNTNKYIESFLLNEGPKLHSDLLNFQKKNKNSNYVHILWTDKYLRDRQPVVLTHNPTMIFKNPKKGTEACSQLLRATNMIFSSIRFCRSLKYDLLEPLIYHVNKEKTDTESFRKWIRYVPSSLSWYAAYFLNAYPLDMSQLQYLMNSTRIPRLNKDELLKSENANHIAVICNSQIYVFDIFKDNGHGVEPKQILANLSFILNQPVSSSYQFPGLGILTTMNRDKWSIARQQLIQLGNEEMLRKIDSAAFVVALDSCSYDTEKELIYNTLHGPAENRWFDKSFSLIFDSKGEAALNFEHSWGDGIAVLTFFNEIYMDSENNPQFSKPLTSIELSQLPTPKVDRLEFNLSSQFTEEILPKSKKEYDDKRHLLNLNMGQNEYINKTYLKSTVIDSDAIMQLAFQMAYYELYNKQAPTYESVSTSGFKCGRTETLRSATMETKAFCELLHKPMVSDSSLYEALVQCSKKHCKLKLEALMGKGWDRHLMGLKHFGAVSGKVPEIFTDPNYDFINHIIISTSTVPSEALQMGGFSAVTRDGYGVGYGIKDADSGAIITTWNDSSHSNGSDFLDALLKSFKKLRSILDKARPS